MCQHIVGAVGLGLVWGCTNAGGQAGRLHACTSVRMVQEAISVCACLDRSAAGLLDRPGLIGLLD
jgi:hypothetical protein